MSLAEAMWDALRILVNGAAMVMAAIVRIRELLTTQGKQPFGFALEVA